MSKKIGYGLWFSLVLYMAAISPVFATIQKPVTVSDNASRELDTYKPLIQNYFSIVYELSKQDFLYQEKEANLRVKKIRWGALWRNPLLNTSIVYAFRIKKSRLAFCLGMGSSTLKYAFVREDNRYPTLKKKDDKHIEYADIDEADLGGNAWGDIESKKVSDSVWDITYVDLLFGLRFNSVLDNPTEGFHAWLRGKVGIRLAASTTIDYDAHGTSNSFCRSSDFNLNRWAFGVQLGMGYKWFGVMGAYALTPLFDKDILQCSSVTCKPIRPFSIAVYLNM